MSAHRLDKEKKKYEDLASMKTYTNPKIVPKAAKKI
jgi:hypothetical protein